VPAERTPCGSVRHRRAGCLKNGVTFRAQLAYNMPKPDLRACCSAAGHRKQGISSGCRDVRRESVWVDVSTVLFLSCEVLDFAGTVKGYKQ
jgi:hypothetical protein